MNVSPRQRVDPFVPIRQTSRHKLPTGQYGAEWLRNKSASAGGSEQQPTAPHVVRTTPVRNTEGIHRAPTRPQQPANHPAHATPFSPVRRTATPQASRLAGRPPAMIPRPSIISDMRPAKPIAPHHEPAPLPRNDQPHAAPTAARVTLPKRRQSNALVRLAQKAQLAGVLLLAVIVGLLAQSLIFGELAICAYTGYAITRHVASRTTFRLALITLVGIILLFVANPDSTTASNFAVYAFLLLAVGAVSLGLEVRRENS